MKKYLIIFVLLTSAFVLLSAQEESASTIDIEIETESVGGPEDVAADTPAVQFVVAPVEEPKNTPVEVSASTPVKESANTAAEKPKNKKEKKDVSQEKERFARDSWEIGSKLTFGLANNMIATADFLTKDIVIDLNDMAPPTGARMNFELLGDAFFKLTIKDRYFLNFFSGVDGGFGGITDTAFLDLITKGNADNHNSAGDVANISGAVFGEIGAGFDMKIKQLNDKLRVGGGLAYYIPFVYIPQGDVKYNLKTETGTTLGVSADIKVYTPFGSDVDVGNIFQSGGVDFSLQAEYALFSFLDLGANINHIPLAPATLKNGVSVSIDDFTIGEGFSISNPALDIPGVETTSTSFSDASQLAMRPMRVDFYADYRPFNNRYLVVRPNIGFSVLTLNKEKGYFNMGALVQTHLVGDLLSFHLGIGYDEGLWKERLGFSLNLRAFEFLTEISMQSQDIDKSFQGSGIGLTLGTRFGW